MLDDAIVIIVLCIAGIILYFFFMDVFNMPDTPPLQNLKNGTAIVTVNFIAKSGAKVGHTFRNVPPDVMQSVFDLLDRPEFGPQAMPHE